MSAIAAPAAAQQRVPAPSDTVEIERARDEVPHHLPGEAVHYLLDSRYCPADRLQHFVQAEFGELDGWAWIAVADDGQGIDPQYHEKIFGLFQRLHTRDEFEGNGAGLAPTPFVRAEGLTSVRCVNDGPRGYLSVRTNADPADRRTDRIGGEVAVLGMFLPGWGMHLADMAIAQGDLIRQVEQLSPK